MSKLDGDGLKQILGGRPPLDLVVVLDVSGSMGSPFQPGDGGGSKIDAAIKTFLKLTDLFEDDDGFGIVTFNTMAHVALPLTRWGDADKEDVRRCIRNLRASGGTSIAVGVDKAIEMCRGTVEPDANARGKQLFFFTDMLPNRNETEQLVRELNRAAHECKMYTCFFGVGVDLDTSLLETLTTVKGLSYYTTSSADEFMTKVAADFGYMVTPCAFDIKIRSAPEDAYMLDYAFAAGGNARRDGSCQLPDDGVVEMDAVMPSDKSSMRDGETKGGTIYDY